MNISLTSWNITHDDILNNALQYLNIKGIKIECPYRHPCDVDLFKKYISNIICSHIITPLYHPSENDTINDNDDISPYFRKAIDNINNELSDNSLDDLIYTHASDTVITTVKDVSSDNKFSYRLSTSDSFSNLVIPYNGCYRTNLKIIMNRFNVEETSFEPSEDIDDKAFSLYIPKYYVFHSDYDISNYDIESDEYKLYVLKAESLLRNKIKSYICQYYCFILDHIEDFSNRILSIDYDKLCSKNVATVEELRETMNEFHINSDELWTFIKSKTISPTGTMEFILELLKQSVSIFCNEITAFCDDAIIVPEFNNRNPLVLPQKTTEINSAGISPIKGDFFDEYFDRIHNTANDDEDDELFTAVENTNIAESQYKYKTDIATENFIVKLCKVYPDRATELGNVNSILSRFNIKAHINKSENELKYFLGANKSREYAGKIKIILDSDRIKALLLINNYNPTSLLAKKYIYYNRPENTSQMYKDALISFFDDDNAINSNAVFKYNMYEDLNCALMKLYELLIDIS